jgi:hypothetical protein
MSIKIPHNSFTSPKFQTECERSSNTSPDSAFRMDNNEVQSPYPSEFKLGLKKAGTETNNKDNQLEEEKTE